ncbi:3966_t:CDS:2, partial [Scutellospora calospora]
RRYASGPEKYRFTEDIIVLGTKPTNKYNTYGVCKACDNALGSQEAVDTYCNKTDNEEELTSQIAKRCQNTDMSNDDNTSDMTSSTTTSTVSNRNSNKSSTSSSREQKLKNYNIGVTLAFDGWKNILKQHIFSSLFILSTRETLIWKAIDISSERERMIEIIPKIESMINEASDIGTNLSTIVSDSASAYFGT